MQHSPDARQETAGYPSTATTEGVLVERCKAGDHAAFAELIHQSSPTARRAIRAITRNPADVDDVMQDTLVKAFLPKTGVKMHGGFGFSAYFMRFL